MVKFGLIMGLLISGPAWAAGECYRDNGALGCQGGYDQGLDVTCKHTCGVPEAKKMGRAYMEAPNGCRVSMWLDTSQIPVGEQQVTTSGC